MHLGFYSETVKSSLEGEIWSDIRSDGITVAAVLSLCKEGPGLTQGQQPGGACISPHGGGQSRVLAARMVRGGSTWVIFWMLRKQRQESGRGDPKIRDRKQKTVSSWVVIEPHPGTRQGQRKTRRVFICRGYSSWGTGRLYPRGSFFEAGDLS